MAGTHVTSPNQLASLHISERKDIKKNMCTSLSVCLTLALPQRQLTSIIQELYPFYIWCPAVWVCICRIWLHSLNFRHLHTFLHLLLVLEEDHVSTDSKMKVLEDRFGSTIDKKQGRITMLKIKKGQRSFQKM